MASVGSTLRTAREQRGLTIEQVAQDTRISQRFLEAIERDEFDALPAPVYVRGFIRSYSSYLRLDAAPLLAELALQGLGGTPAPTQAFPPTPSEPKPARGSEGRQPVDPFARPTSPRSPEPEPELPSATSRGSVPPPPPPPPAPPRAAVPPGRPTPPPPIPPDALEDDFARDRGPFLRPTEGDDQRTSRIFAIVAAVFFGVVGIGALAFVFTRGGDDEDPLVVGDTPTAGANASVVVVPSQTQPAGSRSASPAASASPGSTTTPGTPGTPGSTPSPGSSGATPTTVSGSTPASTTTAAPTPLPTEVPTSIPTTAPTPVPTVTPFPTPTPTATVPIINHPYRFNECLAGDCGPQPRRVVCAPDGWFVDVGYDWGPIPVGWREAFVTGTASEIEVVGDGGCF